MVVQSFGKTLKTIRACTESHWLKCLDLQQNIQLVKLSLEPFLIHQRDLLPSQCSDINSKLLPAKYAWISLHPPFCFLRWNWLLKNCIGQALPWISGFKVPLLHLGPSCSLWTILLSDLVECGSTLQIVMAIWRTFFKIKARQTDSVVYSRLRPTEHGQILKNCRKLF
jgi:hypothetical protein